MKRRAAMRDQKPLRRPLFGVEPSGHDMKSNSRASLEEWLFSAALLRDTQASNSAIVKNSDTGFEFEIGALSSARSDIG
jgi:hypothetical protein